MPVACANALIQRHDGPRVRALVPVGAMPVAMQAPTTTDVVRLMDESGKSWDRVGAHSYLVDGKLVVISDIGSVAAEDWFASPEAASNVMSALRSAQPLLERDGTFARIQERARAFRWDPGCNTRPTFGRAPAVGWIEEVHKGLEGLQRHDNGRLLLARHGCSWGLSHVMQVQRGVLLSERTPSMTKSLRRSSGSLSGRAYATSPLVWAQAAELAA
jgi:hypothetical protein